MKILHINTYDQGGAAIAAIRLHKALLEQGIDSSMLFLNKTNYYLPASFPYIEISKKRPKFLSRQINRLENKINPKETQLECNKLKLQNKIKGFEMFTFNTTDFDITNQSLLQDSDIIHLHYIAGFVDYKVFKKLRKPVIWTLHDMNPFTGGCHYSSGCERFKSDCKDCPQLIGTINKNNSFEDQCYKKNFLSNISPIITAPSAWLNTCSSQSTLFQNFQSFLIPYSLDVSIFKPLDKKFCRQVLNLPDDKIILLFVSDFIDNKRKGFDLLTNSLTQTKLHNIHICAIGNSNKELEKHNALTLLGRVADERIMAMAYSAADVFVLPSREDNLPNVILESLACGTPVIAFQVGGMPDVLKTGFNGILVKELTSESLSKSLDDFLEGKYKFNGNEISENARQKFSPSIQAG